MKDLDDVFQYTTIKMVRIRDRYLGFLHYGFQLAIFVYIIIFVVLVNKGYLNYEEPVGTVRLSLKRVTPSTIGAASNQDYCGINGVGTPATIAVDQSTGQKTQVNVRCRTLDVLDLVYPTVESSAMFIATRITEHQQTRSCVPSDAVQECGPDIFTSNSIEAYYPTDVEGLSLKIQHSVQAPTFSDGNESPSYFGTSETMRGKIYINGNKEKIPPGESDIFLISKLLEAANVTLDAASDADLEKGNSYRYDGIVLVVTMKYYNDWGAFAPAKHIRYDYEVVRLKTTEFKAERVLSQTGNQRVYQNMHGIRLVFLQTGQLGRMEFQTLLVQLVSALALLAIATTIVDQIAIRLMPHRAEYTEAKFDTTEDFSDLKDRLHREEQEAREMEEMKEADETGAAAQPATPQRAAPVPPPAEPAPQPAADLQVQDANGDGTQL